jgi:hypothetical protein
MFGLGGNLLIELFEITIALSSVWIITSEIVRQVWPPLISSWSP